jgi:hypothetical protein
MLGWFCGKASFLLSVSGRVNDEQSFERFHKYEIWGHHTYFFLNFTCRAVWRVYPPPVLFFFLHSFLRDKISKNKGDESVMKYGRIERRDIQTGDKNQSKTRSDYQRLQRYRG